MFVHYLSKVDECISHSAKRCVDTRICMVCNLFEAETVEKSKFDDLLLVLRKHYEHSQKIVVYLLIYQSVFDVAFWFFDDIEDRKLFIFIRRFGDLDVFWLDTVMVDDQIVRNTLCPKDEFVLFLITAFFQRYNDLDKGILEDVICQVFIHQFVVDKAEKIFFVPVDQKWKWMFFTILIL